jgi:hypothetical protein
VKNVKDFYLAKGTEKSYRFLFRVVYNSEVDFYYPKTDIMKLSDGKWKNNIIVRLNVRSGINPFDYIGKEIYQRERNEEPDSVNYFRAKVIDVEKFNEGNFTIFQLYLENLVGNLDERNDGRIYSEGQFLGTLQKLLVGIQIDKSGENYSVGDKIIFNSSNEIPIGLVPEALITRTINFQDKNGQVGEIRIKNPGFNVEEFQIDSVESSNANADGFEGSLRKSFIFLQAGTYLNNDGKLNSNKYIQDNKYYQEFSYVLRNERTLENVKKLVKKILHPSGYEFFSEILIQKCSRLNPTAFVQVLGKKDNRIGNYLPYTFQTFDDLSLWFNENCYSPETHDGLIQSGFTGNPITSRTEFVLVTGPSCSSEGLAGTNLFPSEELGHWVTFQHPNRYLNNSRANFGVARLYKRQLFDFYGSNTAGNGQQVLSGGWREWLFSTSNGGMTSDQIEFFNQMVELEEDEFQNVGLINTQRTEFRKIVIGSFLEFLEYDYDCRRPNISEVDLDEDSKIKTENRPPPTILKPIPIAEKPIPIVSLTTGDFSTEQLPTPQT